MLGDCSLNHAVTAKRASIALLTSNESDTSLYLSSDICEVGSDGLYDCFETCNETAMFSSMSKLHNCMIGMTLSNVNIILNITKVLAGLKDDRKLLANQGSTARVSDSIMTHDAPERTRNMILESVSAVFRI